MINWSIDILTHLFWLNFCIIGFHVCICRSACPTMWTMTGCGACSRRAARWRTWVCLATTAQATWRGLDLWSSRRWRELQQHARWTDRPYLYVVVRDMPVSQKVQFSGLIKTDKIWSIVTYKCILDPRFKIGTWCCESSEKQIPIKFPMKLWIMLVTCGLVCLQAVYQCLYFRSWTTRRLTSRAVWECSPSPATSWRPSKRSCLQTRSQVNTVLFPLYRLKHK